MCSAFKVSGSVKERVNEECENSLLVNLPSSVVFYILCSEEMVSRSLSISILKSSFAMPAAESSTLNWVSVSLMFTGGTVRMFKLCDEPPIQLGLNNSSIIEGKKLLLLLLLLLRFTKFILINF